MRRGQHAADDGSFGRSAGGAMARGIALIVAAVLLGVILLRATDSPEPFTAAASNESADDDDATPPTTEAGSDTTTSTAVPAHNPAEVTVLVANGAGIQGLATRIADQLRPQNYVLAEPGNTIEAAEDSAVYYVAGYEADAAAIAAILNPAPMTAPMPTPPPVTDLKGAHILVVAAADLAAASG